MNDADVGIGQVTAQVQAVDGQGGFSPETLHALAAALAPLLRRMFEHDEQVRSEGSLHNGYLDRIERGSQ